MSFCVFPNKGLRKCFELSAYNACIEMRWLKNEKVSMQQQIFSYVTNQTINEVKTRTINWIPRMIIENLTIMSLHVSIP